MAKRFKTPEGDAGRESTGRFEPLPAQSTAPHRRSWDDDRTSLRPGLPLAATVTALMPATGTTPSRRSPSAA